MADKFARHYTGPSDPATTSIVITPHDSNDLSDVPRALFCTTGGTIRVMLVGDTTHRDFVMVAGQPLALRVKRVYFTGTSASGLVGVW